MSEIDWSARGFPGAMPAHYGYELCGSDDKYKETEVKRGPDRIIWDAMHTQEYRDMINKEVQEMLYGPEFTLDDYFKKLQETPMADDKDMVNSPSHYTQGSIECIEAIEQVVKDLDGMEAMCTGNAIKYLWRWKHKNGVEDLKKAVWYLQRMIDSYDK